MNKHLVVYFSSSGVTKNVASKLAHVLNSDLFEIKPKVPYTDADLDWNNSNSRSSIEMKDKSSRPEIANKIFNIDYYDTLWIGFPIWWYVAPTIINTFLESYDLSNKKIILFATSGMSPMGKSKEKLKPSAPNAKFVAEKRFNDSVTHEELKLWVDTIKLD